MISMRAKHDFARAMERHLRKLRGRIRGLATRFVLGKATRLAADLARVRGEGFAGDASDSDELIQHYGFASIPLPGAEGVRIAVFADGDHGVIVALDDRRYRPTLLEGESALYHGLTEAIVHLQDDGDVVALPGARGGTVRLGEEPGASPVALSTLVANQLALIKQALETHVHTGVTVGAGTTGTAAPSYSPGDVAAAKVRAT